MKYSTSQDYVARRDVFTRALAALGDVTSEFYDAIDNWDGLDDDGDIALALDKQGSNLTGDEYLEVKEAITLFEKLVGRAHESSVSLAKFDENVA